MPTKDPRVDAYIAKAAPFAKPILTRIRKAVHTAVPAIVEDTKWSSPHFDYKGIFCSMAAFKQHCMFGFWKHRIMRDALPKADAAALDSLRRIASVEELPNDATLTRIIKTGAKLNDEGVALTREKRPAKPMPKTPPALLAALEKNAKARTAFAGASPSFKREYIEWIVEAKSDETRQRRLDTAMEWIAAGKGRNWKYEAKKK